MMAPAVVCPLRCGQCCAYWEDVPELNPDRLPHSYSDCPALGARGCTRPRPQRPSACTSYLCGVAAAVRAGRITRAAGIHFKENCLDEVPHATSHR
jgi:hypothetical protein